MKRRTTPKLNIMFSISMVFFVLVMISSYLTCGMYARYVSRATGSDSARVAKFEVTQSGQVFTETFSVSLDPTTTDASNAEILIQNKSEVTVRCEFTFETTGNLPLDIYWTVGGNRVEEYVFSPNDTAGKEFELCVTWGGDDGDNYQYHREIDSVTVVITSVQVD